MPAIPKPKTTLRYTHHPNAVPPFPYTPSSTTSKANGVPNPNSNPRTPYRPPGSSPYHPAMPYDEPASFPNPNYASRIYRPKAGTDGTFSSDWEVRITSFELFVMLLAMLALLIIMAWLAILLLDWLLPRSASRRTAVREVRKLSRALSTFKWDGGRERDAEGNHLGIPLHHSRGGSERFSDRDPRGVRDEEGRAQGLREGITHNLNLLGLGGRSRAGSVREPHRDGQAYAGSRRGSREAVGVIAGHVDVEKGHGGEWVENAENVDVRRRSGAV